MDLPGFVWGFTASTRCGRLLCAVCCCGSIGQHCKSRCASMYFTASGLKRGRHAVLFFLRLCLPHASSQRTPLTCDSQSCWESMQAVHQCLLHMCSCSILAVLLQHLCSAAEAVFLQHTGFALYSTASSHVYQQPSLVCGRCCLLPLL